MNIAIFTNNYLPNPYGVSTSVEGFRRALEKRGHTVYIFAPQWGGSLRKKEQNIFRYPAIKTPTKIDFSLVIPYSLRIDEIISSLHIDVIHAQHPNLLGTVAQKWAVKKNVPLVFTWHSLYDRYAHYAPFVPDRLAGSWAMHNAGGFAMESDHVIVPTASIIPIIRGAGVTHDRISIVPSGVDEELFANGNGAMIRNKYNVTDDQIVLVTVSRLTEEKNVIFLARAVANILTKNPHVIFMCCGEGDLSEKMKSIFIDYDVLQQVIFTGKIDRAMVKHYLMAGDIFVYASTSETQGTIITENMYCGKSIVAVGTNGVGDLIQNEISGIVTVEKEDIFSQSIQRLIDDPQLRRKCGESAYEIARKYYTASVCANDLLRVYEQSILYHQNPL